MAQELAESARPAEVPPQPARLCRPQLVGWTLLGLLPISILTALVVLYLMSGASAAATGGCGGG